MNSMNMSRRKFLALGTGAIAGTIFCPNLAFLKTAEPRGGKYAILPEGSQREVIASNCAMCVNKCGIFLRGGGREAP